MCGICGFIQNGPVGPDSEELVVAMRDEMVHRGPDGSGIHLGKWFALGHRRLSIVDLSTNGAQPMANEDQTVWVTFNGEIYNHITVRHQLEARGHVFHSRSDTEVLVHGWEEWGFELLERLNGMFAFCLVDERKGQVFLARDRMGIKPLYYFQGKGAFVFASEVKSLLRHPDCPQEVNLDVLSEHLLFRHVAGERTLFKGIQELPPANYLIMDRKLQPMIRPYWTVPISSPLGTNETVDFESFLVDLGAAVDRWMMSDVPVGTQLSGGVDSSVVTRLASDRSPYRLKSFSVGFNEAKYNEFPYSTRIAELVGTDHHPILVDGGDFDQELNRMAWLMDVPIDHPNSLFLYLLCKQAKQEVTVLLTGEGADEVLCGYARYVYFQHVWRRYRLIPSFAGKACAILPEGMLPAKLRIIKEWQRRGPMGMAILNSAFGSWRLLELLNSDIRLDLSHREAVIAKYSAGEPLDALLRLDQQVYLASVLHRQDRVSMGASVEARVPFLDHELVEQINRWPLGIKLKNGKGKYILKEGAKSIIPAAIADRSKMGFPVPLREWFRKDGLMSPRLDILLESDSLVGEMFSSRGVRGLIDTHRSGQADNEDDLWILLSLELWHRTFIRGSISGACPSVPSVNLA